MRGRRVLLAALAALAAAALANFCLGASGVSVPDMARAVFAGDRESVAARVFFYVRLPRAAAAAVAGSALAVAGTLLQSVLRNPLAAPSVLGINSGAGLSALVVMAFFPAASGAVPVAAFAGACLAAFAVYALARLTGASRTTIVLAGGADNAMDSA